MDSKTLQNLKEAFAGEAQANRKYLAFAEKAEKEGYINAARMFRAASEAETIHAHSHLRAMKGIGSTAENLKEGVAGETYEFESMYPDMVTQAEAAGEKEAARSFRFAMKAEEVHARLYQHILDNLESQEELSFHLCTVCGNVELQQVDKCPICGAGPKAFKLVD
ncbi:MAG: rubrerythrin family protein [Firmicutes bacterium]|nr:rubrerythrin family protein [Bacillota bacterium]